METLSKKVLKTIEISEIVTRLNEGSTDEKEVTSFVVLVRDGADDEYVEEPFDSRAEAEAYAADVAHRPLRPFNVMAMFRERR